MAVEYPGFDSGWKEKLASFTRKTLPKLLPEYLADHATKVTLPLKRYSPQLVVVLTGIAGAGKTTIAEFIKDRFRLLPLESIDPLVWISEKAKDTFNEALFPSVYVHYLLYNASIRDDLRRGYSLTLAVNCRHPSMWQDYQTLAGQFDAKIVNIIIKTPDVATVVERKFTPQQLDQLMGDSPEVQYLVANRPSSDETVFARAYLNDWQTRTYREFRLSQFQNWNNQVETYPIPQNSLVLNGLENIDQNLRKVGQFISPLLNS